MTTDEVASFTKNPALEEIVQVRIWDDEGKVAGVATPQFSHFMPMLQRLVDQHCGT